MSQDKSGTLHKHRFSSWREKIHPRLFPRKHSIISWLTRDYHKAV